MVKVIPLMVLAMLAGCASVPPPPKVVKIPVAVSCPAPQVPKKPQLPVNQLKTTTPPSQVMKAYVLTVRLLLTDDEQLRQLLSAYGNQASMNAAPTTDQGEIGATTSPPQHGHTHQ